MGEEGKMFAFDDRSDGEQGPNFEETAVNQVNVMNEQIAVKEVKEATRKSRKTPCRNFFLHSPRLAVIGIQTTSFFFHPYTCIRPCTRV